MTPKMQEAGRMGGGWWRWLSLVAAASFLFLGCSSSAHSARLGGPGSNSSSGYTRAVRWEGHPIGKYSLFLFDYVAYCSHGPKPYIDHAHVSIHDRRGVVTVFVQFPPPAHPCLGEEIGVRKRIRFDQPIRRLRIYDGSTVPPQRRWPR